jgi:hypothetical protein
MSHNYSAVYSDEIDFNDILVDSEEKKEEKTTAEGTIIPPPAPHLSPPPLPAFPSNWQPVTAPEPEAKVKIEEEKEHEIKLPCSDEKNPFIVVECKDCGEEFEFSEREREFFVKRVQNYDGKNPVRCKDCIKLKKSNPKAYQEKVKEKKEAVEALLKQERCAARTKRKLDKAALLASAIPVPEISVEGVFNESVSIQDFVRPPVYVAPIPIAQVVENVDRKNPEPLSLVPFRGRAFRINGQAANNNGNVNVNNLPANLRVPPIHNYEGKIREPTIRNNCTHDISGVCAICYLEQKTEADIRKAEVIRLAAIALRIRSRNADRAARHVLGDSSSSDSSGGSSSSSSESEAEPPPPEDVERPIRVVNYQGHYMFDNYENRNKTSETRVFRVPQACFHGMLSAGIHSATDLVRHYGLYYNVEFVTVEMPVSIVNELKPFWGPAVARDVITYKQSIHRCIHLLRNLDKQSIVYRNTVLYAPLLAFWETASEDRGTNAIVNDKLWSWNYCFLLLFVYAFVEYVLFNRAFNPFWVSLLFLLCCAHRFGVNRKLEEEFMRFSHIKILVLGMLSALYLFWFMLITAATYTWQPTENTINYPYTTVNATVIYAQTTVYYSNIGVYDGAALYPLTLTCTLLIIYYRMNELYSVHFLEQAIHNRFDHDDWHIPILGYRQIRSIFSMSVLFAFLQMSLLYLVAPYWVGFSLYLFMKWFNRRFSGNGLPHNYRFLLIDVQFY